MSESQSLKASQTRCPNRLILDQIADKWSIMVLITLRVGPLRFNEIMRGLDGVTQKTLTQCLRRLERNGIVERQVITFSPIAVEYKITELGRSLDEIFHALFTWTQERLEEVEKAQKLYDERVKSDEAQRAARQ